MKLRGEPDPRQFSTETVGETGLPDHPALGPQAAVQEAVHFTRVVVGTHPQENLDKLEDAIKRIIAVREKIKMVRAQMATFKSRYWASGASSHWDLERKALQAKLASEYRRGGNPKLSDKAMEMYVNDHPTYRQFLGQAGVDRLTMENLNSQLEDLHDQIDTYKGVIAYYTQGVRMDEEMVRMNRAQMNLR